MAALGAITGAFVGATDLALLYPLLTIATRRETGASVKAAFRQGNLYSGAATAGTLLIPYSIAVEGLTQAFKSTEVGDSSGGGGGALREAAGTAATSLIIAAGLQPIEKQIVMDQLLQSPGTVQATGRAVAQAQPAVAKKQNALQQIAAYTRLRGTPALYQGFSALFVRELIYIGAVTVLTPLSARWIHQHQDHYGSGDDQDDGLPRMSVATVAAGFGIGFGAGMVSAPCQTVNAIMKDERNRGRGYGEALRREVWEPCEGSVVRLGRRLWAGCLFRSARTGLACNLYAAYRTLFTRMASDR